MSALRKILLVMWKNWIYRKRHKCMTFFEIFIPTVLIIFLVVMRTTGGELFAVKYIENATIFEKAPINSKSLKYCLNEQLSTSSKNEYGYELLYTPMNVFTISAMNCVKNYFDAIGKPINLKNVTDEKTMEDLARIANAKQDKNFWGGISFVNYTAKEGKEFPEKLHYRIRWSSFLVPNWYTQFLKMPLQLPGPHSSNSAYTDSNFLLVQHLIAMFYLSKTATHGISEVHINSQQFPYPPYYKDDGFSLIMSILLPLFLCVSYTFIAPTLIKRVVSEKQLGNKELMKMMGLEMWIQWIGWFFTSFSVMGISALIITFLLFVPFVPGSAIFKFTNPFLFLIIFLLYISCSIAFCCFISTFFTKPSWASGVGVIIWLITYFVPNNSLQTSFDTLSINYILALCLLPNMALTFFIRTIAGFESRNMGLHWNLLLSPGNLGESVNALEISAMMIIDTALYMFLTWYIDNILPGPYGIKKPWYFLFTKYKKSSSDFEFGKKKRLYKLYDDKAKNSDEEWPLVQRESNIIVKDKSYWQRDILHEGWDENIPANQENFEEEPFGLLPAIQIKNLVKEYKAGERVVDNINLNIYQGQITSLLGHNGAGKTTTMSILTGMIPPTKGAALIEGHNVVTDIDRARNSIGLCPQHNMLFDIFTVYEHLLFFGKMKGAKGEALDQEINSLLQRLQFLDKKNVQAKNLSGGMKRKLHLIIALIGGTKVVMLDEPTSGMDPEARRFIWDILQDIRKNRCILLSTHFMEEADILSDRIAIMGHGKIYCCGSPMYLKKKYGAGYHLNITTKQNFNLLQLNSVIQSHIPNAHLTTEVGPEISFTLPAERSKDFPTLFKNLENHMEELGISNFGVSVTTMEEVFLKVGNSINLEDNKTLQKEDDSDSFHENNTLIQASNFSPTVLQYNLGYSLRLQQFYGLLMKHWHYTLRHWTLILIQILIPALMLIVVLLITNNDMKETVDEPSRIMDISQYGSTIAISNNDSSRPNLSSAYQKVFPENDKVEYVPNISPYLIQIAKDNIAAFNNKYIVAADIKDNITIMYNGIYLHSLPLTLNLMHNTFLMADANVSKQRIIVENTPLPKDSADTNSIGNVQDTAKSALIGIFIPIGLSVLAASFVRLPTEETVNKAKHLQLMTGVGGFLYWTSSFLWDFLIVNIATFLLLLLSVIVDKSNLLYGDGQAGVIYLVLILYGWSAIPFSYIFSFFSKKPASGFNFVLLLNLITALILGIVVSILKAAGNKKVEILQWFARLIPIYPVAQSFMMISQVSLHNSACKIKDLDILCKNDSKISLTVLPCCQEKCDKLGVCFKRYEYMQWDSPGINQEILMMIINGFLYFTVIIIIEQGLFYKLWYLIRSIRTRRNALLVIEEDISDRMDVDVSKENVRVIQIAQSETSNSDALIVHNLTKHFWSFVAVDEINFGVKRGECFGLLGINGAGKTTAFRMLTGDEILTNGNAYINAFSLKHHRSEFLRRISYCPQFDALIEHLTPREHLLLFSRLRGIHESQIRFEIDKMIFSFDLEQHSNKTVLSLSGGNKRKLSSAIAFLGNLPIVLLDEPTTGIDAIARRKLWQIILSARLAGISIVLTSHSMEECEVLCSRLAIMVNGKFQCLGGIQHLKNKFGQGFTIMVKLKITDEQQETNKQKLYDFFKRKFPSSILKDVHQNIIHYHIMDHSVSWTYLFQSMEEAKEECNLEDYSVSQTTLEQIFLFFAKKQRLVEQPDNSRIN